MKNYSLRIGTTLSQRRQLRAHLTPLLSLLLAANGCMAGIPSIDASGISVPGMSELSSFIETSSQQLESSGPSEQEVSGIDSEVPELLKELGSGKKVDISSVLSDELDGRDEALARSERGRLAQLQNEGSISVEEFNGVVEKIKDFDERASVSARDIAAQAAALVINDNMIPYEPSGFERVLVYHFQALNYLMEGKTEDAGVEVRRANAEQEEALKAHEAELVEAEAEAKENGFKSSDIKASVMQSLGGARQVAALVKNSFQNAYTFYMSAVVHEIMNEPNDAFIDYKKALEIAPSNTVIQRDVARLAKALSMTDDIGRLSRRFPAAFAAAKPVDKSRSEVIVLFEDGVVPGKEAISFPIPIPIPSAPGLTAIAIPTFKASVAPVRPIALKAGGKELARSQSICAIDALAVKAYEESAPAMITRQIVRAAIKGTASSLAGQHGGALAGLAVGAVAAVTEIADTRSWRSLPQNAQVLRTEVAPGAILELVHQGSGATGKITVPTESGKRVIVRVSRIGSKLFIQNIAL